MAFVVESGNPFGNRKWKVKRITKTLIVCGDRGQIRFKKPIELKSGTTLDVYPRERFIMMTYTYKEADDGND